MKRETKPAPLARIHPLGIPLLFATVLCLMLYVSRVVYTGSFSYWFINWNLLLAWLPVLWAVLLVRSLRRRRWLSWQNLGLTALWLIFLPNSFYLVTDFVHLNQYEPLSLMFDIVMFMMYALTGLTLGWIAVYLVHRELRKRKTRDVRWLLLGMVFLLCSFAIFMGRNLGWNSWDVVIDPFGITIDLLERLSYPNQYPETYSITALFFVFISGTYFVFYTTVKALNSRTM